LFSAATILAKSLRSLLPLPGRFDSATKNRLSLFFIANQWKHNSFQNHQLTGQTASGQLRKCLMKQHAPHKI
jgi:hypothetical protein